MLFNKNISGSQANFFGAAVISMISFANASFWNKADEMARLDPHVYSETGMGRFVKKKMCPYALTKYNVPRPKVTRSKDRIKVTFKGMMPGDGKYGFEYAPMSQDGYKKIPVIMWVDSTAARDCYQVWPGCRISEIHLVYSNKYRYKKEATSLRINDSDYSYKKMKTYLEECPGKLDKDELSSFTIVFKTPKPLDIGEDVAAILKDDVWKLVTVVSEEDPQHFDRTISVLEADSKPGKEVTTWSFAKQKLRMYKISYMKKSQRRRFFGWRRNTVFETIEETVPESELISIEVFRERKVYLANDGTLTRIRGITPRYARYIPVCAIDNDGVLHHRCEVDEVIAEEMKTYNGTGMKFRFKYTITPPGCESIEVQEDQIKCDYTECEECSRKYEKPTTPMLRLAASYA